MQFTIEARELTNGHSDRRTRIEADDADDAIGQFVRSSEAELVSLSCPGGGAESIATVKKEDALFLVRIYTD